MKSFLVGGVFLLLFVFSLEVMYCEGCLKQERAALIDMSFRLGNSLAWTRNIFDDYYDADYDADYYDVNKIDADCCEWKGVECNTTTGRVTKLKLMPSPEDQDFIDPIPQIGPWQPNYSDFVIFKDLKTLDLSGSGISDCTTTNQGLNNLEVLDLNGNNFKNALGILSCLDGLSSLKSLSLAGLADNTSYLHIFQTVLETISSKLLQLEALDIGYNDLSNEILPSLRVFTSLKELHLNAIGLDSDLHFQGLCASLKNLEILHLSKYEYLDNIPKNNFSDTDIASALSGLSSLKSLDLAGSEITLRSIHNISKLRSLEILDLSSNHMDSWPLENHGFAWPASLQDLVLRENGLSNNIISSLNGLPRLKSLDLSINNLNGSLDINENHGFRFAWPSSLQVLSLSGNSLSNKILSQLSGLPHLKSLDLSSNNLKGSLDISGLSTLTSLKILDFGYNQLIDLVVHKGSKNLSGLDILYLDSNMINGSNLQEWLWAFPSIRNLILRYNEFKGTILEGGFRGLRNLEYLTFYGSSNLQNEFFKSIGDLPSLKVLSVLRCGMNGTLPIGDWYKLKKLEVLDLSYNEFVGKFPSSFFNMTSLRTLKLTDNHFIGFRSCY